MFQLNFTGMITLLLLGVEALFLIPVRQRRWMGVSISWFSASSHHWKRNEKVPENELQGNGQVCRNPFFLQRQWFSYWIVNFQHQVKFHESLYATLFFNLVILYERLIWEPIYQSSRYIGLSRNAGLRTGSTSPQRHWRAALTHDSSTACGPEWRLRIEINV